MKDLPGSFVDFKDALRLLSESQSDVIEMISKFSGILNTTIPGQVTVTVGGVQYTVENLAQIKKDLQSSLKDTYPNINSSRVVFNYSVGTATSTRGAIGTYKAQCSFGSSTTGSAVTDGWEDPSKRQYVRKGWYRGVTNDFFTLHWLPDSSATDKIVVSFKNLPRLQVVGVNGKDPAPTEAFIAVKPIASNDSEFPVYQVPDYGAGSQYYTTVRFVNHGLSPFTLHLYSSTATDVAECTVTIPARVIGTPDKYVDVLFWCARGQDKVNISAMTEA